MFLPCTVHVSRSTWYREVNMFKIFMIFVSWINGQEEYCLSSARILTSRYQSIVDNRVKIERTSNVVDVMEYCTLNNYIVLQRRINEIMSRVSLKSTEEKDCSRIIRAILISPFWTSSCCQTRFPTLIRPMLYLWELVSWVGFDSPELNCSILFPLYCLILSKKTDHFLGDFVCSERWCWWLNVNPFSFVRRYDTWCVNMFPLLWLCFCLWSGCNNLDTCLWLLIFTWICRDFCIVVISIDHVLVCSIRYSDPRLRIILTLRPDSNFNPMFAVLKTGCDF